MGRPLSAATHAGPTFETSGLVDAAKMGYSAEPFRCHSETEPVISSRRRTGPAHLASIALDPAGAQPLNRQLYFAVRDAILDARLQPGTRLPSTRALADDLKVSRNTVMAAFEQLLAEGYIEGRVGAGSFVSRELPEETLHARAALVARRHRGAARPGLSQRGAYLASLRDDSSRPRAFSPGLPELAAFPFEEWARLLAKHWRAPPRSFLIGGDPAGHRPLREAIADYLGAARAVACTRRSGVRRLGSAAGARPDRARADRPGRHRLDRGAGLSRPARCPDRRRRRLAAVPVDAEGLDVEAGRAVAPAGAHGLRLAIAPVSAGRHLEPQPSPGAAGLGQCRRCLRARGRL